VYVRDFLDWAYAKGKSAAQLQEEALAWWVGLEAEQARQGKPEEWSNILRHTARWDWPTIQRTIRERIERIFLPGKKQRQAELVSAERQLGIFTAPDGERYWNYRTVEFLPKGSAKWVSRVIDRVLFDLQDLSVKVVNRCEECARLFVRLRPSVGRYCSPGCRHLAYLKAHGFRPPGETTGTVRGKKSSERTRQKRFANIVAPSQLTPTTPMKE
jgi:hypothetical protein